MDSYQEALVTAVLVGLILMGISFATDRIYLQWHRHINIGENARKVWGVLILAGCAAQFLYLAFPANIAIPVFVGLLIIVGVPGIWDLILHWAWSTIQMQIELAALKQNNQALEKQAQGLAEIARGQGE